MFPPFALALAAIAASDPPPRAAVLRMAARTRLVDPLPATDKTWNPRENPRQREKVIVERDGSRTLLRLTEVE